jgi:glycosyltransferase involved in cell wall biosynthesis
VSIPKATVITPTWQRHDLLMTRCIPSVQAQGYPSVEHVIISDGPDSVLRKMLAEPWLNGWKDLWFHELPEHPEYEHWGASARLAGLELASGEYITYCDDDDSLRPYHCYMLAAALDAHPEAAFAVSRMLSHGAYGDIVIGNGQLAAGNVGTPMIMHRRDVPAKYGTWGPPNRFEDWNVVWGWLAAGAEYVRVQAETSDVWPSIFR